MGAPSDLTQIYLDRQQQRANDDTDAEFAQLLGGGVQQQQPAAAGPPAPQPTGNDPSTPAPSGFSHEPGVGQRVARDVGLGITHAPSESLGGAIDAVHQEAKTVKDLGDWVSSKLPEALRGGIAYTPEKGLHFAGGEEIDQLPGATEAIANLIPTTGSSGTVTGGMIRSVAQFIAGQAATNAVLPGLGGAGLAGRVGAQAVTGATAFDPQAHLSNLIQEVPQLANPVTEWLSAKPGDSDAEGRLKNAIEGLGIGAASEGLVKAFQAAKAGIFARGAEQAAGDTEGAARQVFAQADEARQALAARAGDVAAPALEIRPAPALPAETGAAAAAADRPGEVYVNWARIQAPDDVKAMVQQLADARGGNISDAARGVRTWEATKLDAATKDAWGILQSRKSGQPLGAEESVAVRELWVRSAQRMVGLARAVDAGGGEADQIAFRQALSVHNAIQEQVVAARTETARALNSWSIPAGQGTELAGQVQQLRALAQSQAGSTAELAKGVMQLANAGKVRELDAFIESAAGSTRADRIRQLWYSGLLSNPKTHVRNVVGNLSNLLLDIPETAMGEGAGVAKEKLFGLVSGFRDAWTVMKRGTDVLEAEGPGLSPGLQEALAGSKLDPVRANPWSPEAAGITPDSAWGKAFSVMDAATSWQGRWLESSDRVFKALAWNVELRAGAYRQATEELTQGTLVRADFADRMADLMANPSEQAKLAARTFADAKTFQGQPLNTKLWRAAKGFHDVPLLGDVFLPFLKTPYNMYTQVMQRTPVAPFMKSWAADIAEGGTRADMAWARFVMGNAVLLTAADLTLSGHLTAQGPADPAARATLARQGWKPWSAKIGDRYFDYRSFDPIGPALGLAAYAAETIAGRDYGDSSGFDRAQQVVVSTALGIGAQVLSTSYMSGMADFVNALSDPQRAGDSLFERMVTSAVVPRGVAQLERVLDPTQRAAYDVVSSIRAQTPGLSESMPARRDLWGRPITVSSGLGWVYDMLSPVSSSKENAEPIDQELSRLGARVPLPNKKLSFQVLTPHGMDSATVDLFAHPEMYQRYLELAGQVVPERLSGKPLMAALNDLVQGKHPLSGLYQALSDGPEGGKADQIQELIRSTQVQARQRLLDEFPALKAEAQYKASQQGGRFNLTPR